uniref:NADH-ubiquinone oxidoreductase chain 2 n=1 Tax=Margaritifera margaritifera TaxID=2505931 RepID=A0A4Y5QSF1_9BIVA|nr:NADH dehydrogenase subunit 2 [Margaritifera margaritifera]QRW36433.1 NADH dehydrogenase subunit 2 [Margaritifera margaritifera]
MKSPHKLLFMFLMTTSTVMVLSSSNWLTTWMGLEINMLGFIPLMYHKITTNESETVVKYLVPQSLGSTIFIVGALISYHFNSMQILMPIAMCLKLGAAPLHLWFPAVMSGLSLTPAFTLLTWQKIAPIFAISSMDPSLMASILPIAGISALWGGIGGLNQTDVRLLLSYSSIAHTGWMLASITAPAAVLTLYLTMYILINISLFTALTQNSVKMHKQLLPGSQKPYESFLLAITILSLGGLPPLTGFAMKLLVLMFTQAKTIILVSLISGAILSLYYYLSLTFSPLLSLHKMPISQFKLTTSTSISFLLSQIMPLSLLFFFF